MSTPGILDAIDSSLRDNSVSGDAMRWSPDPEGAERDGGGYGTADWEAFTAGLNDAMTAFAQQMQEIGRAMTKAFQPVGAWVAQVAHDLDVADRPRWHATRCRQCNPAGNPLPLPGGREYRRRQKARKRRAWRG